MFEFLKDMHNYSERMVKRYEEGDTIISTARVSDARQPFETAVSDPRWNNGEFVVVAMYDTREDAEIGHEQWVKKITTSPPVRLLDVGTSGVSEWIDVFGGKDWRIRE